MHSAKKWTNKSELKRMVLDVHHQSRTKMATTAATKQRGERDGMGVGEEGMEDVRMRVGWVEMEIGIGIGMGAL